MIASIAMAVGVWGILTWAEGSFVTVYVVTALVAFVGGLVVVPLLSRSAARAPAQAWRARAAARRGGRSSAD
ncbi:MULTISPECIES: hypothetical protein [unclassified Micromonospora]|uniref:hypothetical protein n=1 Tax=unclassified Micromonospora TaxID=2617518 RepID=UPI00362AD8A2